MKNIYNFKKKMIPNLYIYINQRYNINKIYKIYKKHKNCLNSNKFL